MATPWSGFSLEDQAKIKSELDIKRDAKNETDSALQTADITENKEAKSIVMQKKNKVNPKKTSHSSISSCHTNDLPNEAMLSAKPKQEKVPESPVHVKLRISEDKPTSFEIMEAAPLENGINDQGSDGSQNASDEAHESTCCQPPNSTLSVDLLQSGVKKDPVNLDEFEKKQKLIEEQNRLKKQMLAKALALRKMKTQAEAIKIHQIQEELSKLDANLSNDVCILRSHIEIASVELSEAEKRYTKAEREFVEAKQLLFNKRERKDLLTEHLCTIIEQNEMRKAHRLTDLMIQLDDEDHRAETLPAGNRLIDPMTIDEV